MIRQYRNVRAIFHGCFQWDGGICERIEVLHEVTPSSYDIFIPRPMSPRQVKMSLKEDVQFLDTLQVFKRDELGENR